MTRSSNTLLSVLLTASIISLTACRQKENFPPLGTNLASPVDIANSEDGKYFYTLNADFDRKYNTGSILVMNDAGEKLRAIEVPRMGRSLNVVGTTMIATVDYGAEAGNSKPHVFLFDLNDPANPALKADLTVECSPIASAMRKNYAYFSVTCSNGTLYVGKFGSDLSQSQLYKVRQFTRPFRALYLDSKRNLLLGFPDQPDKPNFGDIELVDVSAYNKIGIQTGSEPNEIPDQFEQTRRAWADLGQRQSYQFFVYDIAAEEKNAPNCSISATTPTCDFPFREYNDAVSQGELRWTYFRLKDYSGAPDESTYFNNPSYKYYRTNFYAARPDPEDADVFYLSQRGAPNSSPNANQILRVRINGELRPKLDTSTNNYTFNPTSQEFSFDRVYGFKGPQSNKLSYPGDFRVVMIDNQKTVVVNNFRDLVNWVRSDATGSYWIGASLVDDPSWYSQLSGQLSPANDIRTYYQVAVNEAGRGASCSFYGNQIIFFDVVPGVAINIINQVR